VRALRPSVLLAAAVLVTGCNPFTGACTTDYRWGIVVDVHDAVTGEPAAFGSRLTVRDRDYVETVDGPPLPEYAFLRAAGERPGRYEVTVQKPGYQDWTRGLVWVRHDGCHVVPVRLDARLQPAG
jgi:hypothetical protein